MAKAYQCTIHSISDENIFNVNRVAQPLHLGNLIEKICSEDIGNRKLNQLRIASFEKLVDRFFCCSFQFKIRDNQKPLMGEDTNEDLVKIEEDLYKVSYWVYDCEEDFLYYISQRGAPNLYEFNRYLNHYIDFYNAQNNMFTMDKIQIERNRVTTIDEILADFRSIRSFELVFDLNEFEYSNVEGALSELYVQKDDDISTEIRNLLLKSNETIKQAKVGHFDFYTSTFTLDKNNELFKDNKRVLVNFVKYLNFQNDRLSEVIVEGKYKTGDYEKKKLKSKVYVVYTVVIDYTYIREAKFIEIYKALIKSVKGGDSNEQIQANI